MFAILTDSTAYLIRKQAEALGVRWAERTRTWKGTSRAVS